MGKWLDAPETLLFEVKDKVAYITFNRPDKRNAQSTQALQELNAALWEADDLTSVRTIVLQGNGKDFCAGADITGGPPPSARKFDPNDYRGKRGTFEDDTWIVERGASLRLAINQVHKPVIGKIHGHCLAVGTDIALHCDIIIAANDAKIGFPATRSLGSPANHMWLYHVGPQWAKRMLMTGDIILGKDAARIGLVLKAVPAAKLDAEVEALAKRIALIDPDLQAAHKRIVNLGLELMGRDTLQRLASENDARAHLSPAFTQFFKDVKEQGLKEALRRRDAPFDGRSNEKYGDSIIKIDQED